MHFCPKLPFWRFWRLSGWTLAKLALIWSKMHLWHDSLPFLPLASRFRTFWLGHVQKSKFWDEKVIYVFRLFDFWIFFTFPFSPFLFFLLQWLTFCWACLQFKNFQESVIETGNFYQGVATCSDRKFCCEFFISVRTSISGSIRPITLIWILLERSFPHASVDDANFIYLFIHLFKFHRWSKQRIKYTYKYKKKRSE